MSPAPRFGPPRACTAVFLAAAAGLPWLGCATSPRAPTSATVVTLPPLPPAAPPPASAGVQAVAARYGVSASTIVASPSGQRFLLVRRPEAHEADAGTGYVLVMVSPDGRELGRFPSALPGIMGDVTFLGEDNATYTVLTLARSARVLPVTTEGAPHVVQPLVVDRTPRICRGRAFVFSPDRAHLVHVSGGRAGDAVWLDGQPLYPAASPAGAQGGRGRVTILGAPAFSPDGRAVAFIEGASGARGGATKAQLVLLENLEGRATEKRWDLPSAPKRSAAREVFWQGTGHLLVGASMTNAVFETTR